ncbi:hypothetical protein CN878_06060 [Ochrobactrum sp. 695/2009]|nr:hypothetical protein O206_05360 [Ochrobactrum sp. EGD-AQ16]KAB2669249.1 hypothetical protein F9K77_16800 [Ochrobactrum sp. LMG 5442]KAB2696798.1 hypothetical protein F9K72_01205 [Brucella intermedia]PJR94287.1 hypothetical protein CN881_01325 [Ochrobactrum sp. 721/2009]PJT17571.1 hypothetical protein CN880_02790 [Ochrobactrum sp. 720/2009]PJT21923.1 hypothetical protein CN879_11460 [Ochrobactrum sp. 715/2009]PJT30919.1 hypothetical protein CN878_06060 [Ochrobactrum sp. 695/2009]PJT32933.1
MTALQADGDPVSGRHSCLTASAGFGFDMNAKATTVGKDGHSAFSVFQRRLGSVMAFVMNRNFLFFISAIVLVALAACGKGDDESAATTNGGEQGAAAISQPAKPAESTGTEKGPDLVKSLRESSGVVTPEEKAAAIERARANAVAAAQSVGQTDEQAQAAGEAAAAVAQRSFNDREPQQ